MSGLGPFRNQALQATPGYREPPDLASVYKRRGTIVTQSQQTTDTNLQVQLGALPSGVLNYELST